MPEAHEQIEQAEHTHHAAEGNRTIALVIAIMALFLAFSETLGKGAQTEAISLNIRASDTWNFFQAKTIRQTAIRTAAEGATVQLAALTDADTKAAAAKQIKSWMDTVTRYESDPKERDGRKELRQQAEQFEHDRETALARYHNYELASGAFQIGIVLCSAAVVTSMALLAWIAGGVALIGAGFLGLGLLAPHLVHFG